MKIPRRKLKIALLSLQKDTQRVPSIGLIYLATYLRDRVGLDGDNIRVFDNYYAADIAGELESYQPDLVGFTAMSVNYGETVRFARRVRGRFPVPFIVGGVHISTLPESLDPVFDLGVLGEGEKTLGELVEVLLGEGSLAPAFIRDVRSVVYRPAPGLPPRQTPRRDQIADLDELPFPDFGFAHPGFFAPEEIPAVSAVGTKAYVLSSRGCPYRCSFCSTSRFWGGMRLHSPDYTAQLVANMVNGFGADYLWAWDDLFAVSPGRVREIREALIRRGVFDRLKGAVFMARANLVTDELCEEMKRTRAVMVNFGFESGSDRVLGGLKMGTVTVEQNRRAILLCRKHGINVYGSLMYGVPGETIADMEKTNEFIDFAIRHGARNIWSFVAAPYPGTPFWNEAVRRGKVGNDMDWGRLGCHDPWNPLLLDDSVDRAAFVRVFNRGRGKLRRLKIRLVLDFARRNPLSLVRLFLREPRHYLVSALSWITRQ